MLMIYTWPVIIDYYYFTCARTFFVLDFGFDILDGVAGLHLEGDGFTRQRFHKNLHLQNVSARLRWANKHRNHTKSQLRETHATRTVPVL